MRIPLDYYRILGLPIQATAEQLRQAHRDRALQLPRREYSEAAIAARKQLLDEAYSVLSDVDQRQAYDASFLAKSYELETDPTRVNSGADGLVIDPATDPYTPSIEIEDYQLVGALLILLELGEYELVLRLGRPYLSGGTINSGRYGQPEIVLSDIVLTIAFACLELGREQWQQGQYENAAVSLEAGQEILLREGLFPGLRGEMQADLYKLRPYRILELLANPNENAPERRQGLPLLQDMLQDRGGIDGAGDDQSGLNVDDFLRFIQQLRSYLTAAEQQSLFEAEARRPSAVATYLAVYALLARGFAYRQPALIRRAKLMLVRLGTRQDVHLEQAVCALLLGQTEEASRALDHSQEFDSLAFIREHSQGSPDLLPGLCLYGERWLQNEVFPHFRDLNSKQASLKEYFADEQVQSYLEELPNEPESVPQWSAPKASVEETNGRFREPAHRYESHLAEQGGDRYRATSGATATLDNPQTAYGTNAAMPTAERVSQVSPEGRLNGGAPMPTGGGRGRSPQTFQDRKRPSGSTMRIPSVAPISSRRPGAPRRPRLDRLLFLFAIGFIGIGTLVLIVSKLTQASAGSADSVQALQPQLAPAITTVADAVRPTATATGELTEAQAQDVIETWLQTKTLAMGKDHRVEELAKILADPILSQWQSRAEEAKSNDIYVEYEHTVKVTGITVDEATPDEAQVDAEVTETSKVYQGGQLDVGDSSDDNLQVRYSLIRQGGQWRIQAVETL